VSERASSFEGVAVPIAVLEEAPLFAGLGPAELAGVASAMRFRSFEAGAVICREGEPGDSMFVIVGGLVHLLASLAEEPQVRTRSIFDEGRLVGRLRSRDVLGTGALITGEPRSATARAAVDTDVLELGRDDFRALIARFPAILENLTGILTRQLAEATSRHARTVRRGEAVALVAAPGHETLVAEAIGAATAAGARPVAVLDAGASLAAALERLDPLLRDSGTVLVTHPLDGAELPQLLSHVDRTVALAGTQEEAERIGRLAAHHGVKGQPVEVVLGAGVELPAAGGDAVRAVGALGDAAWLGRHLARAKLGLALGAGGAKGYAHVGALAVLEEAGYAVDAVAGSSIGAVVGAYIALGMRAEEIDRTLRERFDEENVAAMFKLALSGGSTGLETMERLVRETTGERTFADLGIPFAAMTVDLDARAPAPITEGPLWEALMAATALAGMFPPRATDGRRLIDGLALVPVPSTTAYELGADVVVSVNLMPRETLAAWPGQPPPPPPAESRGVRMLETILEVMDLAQLEGSNRHAELADVVLNPRFGPSTWRDFQLADLFYEAGAQAAREALPALAALARPQGWS
jgi:NTE family protein